MCMITTSQKSLDVSDHLRESGTKPPPSPTTPQSTEVDQRVTITFAQLVNNFTNIFKGIAKRQGLNDPGYLAISVNQMKSFLDEFSKGRCVDNNIDERVIRKIIQ